MSFSDYIKWSISINPRRQIDFVADEDGNIIVDYIGRFESINEDLEFIQNKLNIQNSTNKLPSLNVSTNREFRDYRKYYNDKTKMLVGEYFRKDIETFEYAF